MKAEEMQEQIAKQNHEMKQNHIPSGMLTDTYDCCILPCQCSAYHEQGRLCPDVLPNMNFAAALHPLTGIQETALASLTDWFWGLKACQS